MFPKIVVEEYDPKWADAFSRLKAKIWPVVSHSAISIEHVGSTAVVGMAAKPVIDIDIVIESAAALPNVIERLESIGYEHRGNLGVEGREAFEAKDNSIRHHLYVCLRSAAAFRNHILLRDRLRKDDEARVQYSRMKKELASKFPNSIDDYIAGKTAFILNILKSEGVEPAGRDAIREANRPKPVLIFACGERASGKSTLARKLAPERNAVLLSVDDWVEKVGYPVEGLKDYARYFKPCRELVRTMAVEFLKHGTSVVFDFGGNNPAQRAWVRSIIEETGCAHELYFLNVSETVRRAQFAERQRDPDRAMKEETLEEIKKAGYQFLPPASEEGFNVIELKR